MLKNIVRVFIFLFPIFVIAQVHTDKEVNNQTQSWFSSNNNFRLNDYWALLVDLHVRRNDFVSEDSFYFTRIGAAYMPSSKILLASGYAHMWLAPTKESWENFSNEERIYQQGQYSSKIGEVIVLQRIRNEQRWQQKMINDEWNGEYRFTDRVRYLLSFTIPISKNKKMPLLVLSDEILIHFGKEVVYNTFDQNRIFIGIKQAISPKLSFDFGYMNVYQQKYSGYQYDSNHTLRLFFYYNNSFKNLPHFIHHTSGDE